MGEFKKRATVIIIVCVTILVMAGLIIYLIVNPFPQKKQTSDSPTEPVTALNSKLENTENQNTETERRQPHTIVIENVQNTRQLSEILNIIETYTRENEISNLKIECIRKEDMDSSRTPPPVDE